MAGIRLNIGLTEFRRGNYREAIAPLQSVIRDKPDSHQARYLLGLCQMFTDQFADAVKTLEPLWEPMSTDVMYLYVLGISANRAGHKELDDKVMRRLIAVGKNTPEFHLILAKAYLQHLEYDSATTELQKALAMNPDLPFAHFNLGIAYLNTGRSELSEGEFRKDIAIDPELADNYFQLAQLYAQQQRDAEAESLFREALKRDPHRSGAWFGLAKLYQEQGKPEQALRAIDEAVKLVPKSERVRFLRGQILQRLGRTEEAKVEFATAKKLMNEGLQEDRERAGSGTRPGAGLNSKLVAPATGREPAPTTPPRPVAILLRGGARSTAH